MKRGTTLKRRTEQTLTLERKMVTHHDVLQWDLDRCVGCQLGPKVCPKDALSHVGGVVAEGHVATKLLVDVDTEKCVFCGMCVVMCPVNAISMTLDGESHIPVQAYGAFPLLVESQTFDPDAFDWSLKDFVIDNCPTNVISYDESQHALAVDDVHCIHCRQCEVASDGAFHVEQPWEGTVTLRREECVEGCLACADVCPTRALYIDDAGELVLADYYCIKCGACVQVCPVEPVLESYEVMLHSQGVTHVKQLERIANTEELPIWVERWRVRHTDVQSGAWVEALAKLADDKAMMVEIERKRAIKRRDLIIALKGGKKRREHEEGEASRHEELLRALKGSST